MDIYWKRRFSCTTEGECLRQQDDRDATKFEFCSPVPPWLQCFRGTVPMFFVFLRYRLRSGEDRILGSTHNGGRGMEDLTIHTAGIREIQIPSRNSKSTSMEKAHIACKRSRASHFLNVIKKSGSVHCGLKSNTNVRIRDGWGSAIRIEK